jgi:hypothetical protein
MVRHLAVELLPLRSLTAAKKSTTNIIHGSDKSGNLEYRARVQALEIDVS